MRCSCRSSSPSRPSLHLSLPLPTPPKMPVFSKIALFAGLALSSVSALPWDTTSKMATHKIHKGARDVEFTTYHPTTTYETFGDGVDHPLSKRAIPASAEEAALAFLATRLGISRSEIKARTGYDAETATHVYIRQKLNGIEVANSVANVSLKNSKIIAYGSNFVKPKKVATSTPRLTKEEAIAFAEEHLDAKYNDWPTKLEYIVTDADEAKLTHVVQVQNDDHWFEAFVDAETGSIVNVVDFVAHASYRVVPFDKQDPTWGGFSLKTDPADLTASPNGWHTVGSTTYTTTKGNNVVAYKTSASTGLSSQTSSLDNFDYTWNSAVSPTTSPNIDVARVNAFYVGNSIHDLYYKYGFTEKAYNFQTENYGKGGAGNDAVQLSVQASGSNNANFATPADGQTPTCQMYTWTYNTPNRDGDLSNDVITHEFTHGLTNRMTGGGTGRCLSTTESGGMGEGWGDAMAMAIEQNSTTIGPFTLGSWVYNNGKGIRSYPYSTDKTINPLMYSDLKTRTEVHSIGEVWANILVEVYSALVGEYGWSADIFNANLTTGNNRFFHLVIDALALQPCSPTFLTARNAIIQADTNRYAGANKCLLWNAFAKRGLGVNAASYTNNAVLPTGC